MDESLRCPHGLLAEVVCDACKEINQRELLAGVAAYQQSTVNHPAHYNAHPSGIEVIEIVRHMGFNLGNVVKYILRCDEKGNAVEDLEKARWYLDDEIAKRKKAVSK